MTYSAMALALHDMPVLQVGIPIFVVFAALPVFGLLIGRRWISHRPHRSNNLVFKFNGPAPLGIRLCGSRPLNGMPKAVPTGSPPRYALHPSTSETEIHLAECVLISRARFFGPLTGVFFSKASVLPDVHCVYCVIGRRQVFFRANR
jgi:hypothetical protein